VANSDVLEFDRIHQVMQRNVSIATTQASEQGRHQPRKSHERITAERAEQQIEPDDIRFDPVQRLQQAEYASRIIERPAAQDGETFGFDVVLWQFVGQNGEREKRIAPQLLRKVEPIFTQSSGTWGKGCDQTDLHSSPALQAARVRCTLGRRCWQVASERNRFNRSVFSLGMNRRSAVEKTRPFQNRFACTSSQSLP
jgi:hypothetical protein